MDLDPRACYRAIVTRDARFDGRLFVGVRTTGIYCRPICPARTPKREHVMFLPKAAAVQEAGFRPCLRCRPEAAPDFAAWRGTSNTVARALSLIEMGGLDEADVETLSARLGLGERQLRRLFRQHLGASPIAVAQTRRVLLAKQLLRETTLPMSDVALASGFGSIRRFNETFQRLFQRPPGTLRRSGRSSSSARGAVSLQLGYKPPSDWASMLAFLRARAIAGVEVVTGDTYWRTIEVGGAHGIVAVTHGHKHAQRVRVHCPQLSALPVIIARLRRLFDLSADPQTIGAHLSEDPVLAPLLAARPGLRGPGGLGRVRTRRARRVGTADQRARCDHLGRSSAVPVWRPRRSGRGPCRRLDDGVSDRGAVGVGIAGRLAGTPCAGDCACGAGEDRGRQSSALPRRPDARGGGGRSSRAERDRRVDRALHRDARAPRAGRVPPGGRRFAARTDRLRRSSSRGSGGARARRALAPMASVRGATPVDG